MTSLAWLAASSRAALCCWANSLERPPGFPETPGSQLGLPALPIFDPQFALKFGRGPKFSIVCHRLCLLVQSGKIAERAIISLADWAGPPAQAAPFAFMIGILGRWCGRSRKTSLVFKGAIRPAPWRKPF